MKTLITFLVSFFLLSSVSFACSPNTEKEFFAHVYENGWQPYTLTESGQKKLKKIINAVRSRNNAELLSDTSEFYFAGISVGVTGTVFIDNGCVVEGTVLEIPSTATAKLFFQAGIKPEEIVEVISN